MSNFIKNLNSCIDHYKIKHTFISNYSGIEMHELSKFLTEKQNIKPQDMEKISKLLGKELDFFMNAEICLNEANYENPTSITFHMGEVDEQKKELAKQIFEFLENVDAILSVQKTIDLSGIFTT